VRHDCTVLLAPGMKRWVGLGVIADNVINFTRVGGAKMPDAKTMGRWAWLSGRR
jgi:hypothetical protein